MTMLAVDQKNKAQKPTLTVVDRIGTTELPKGLIAIKALLGSKRYKPQFIFDSVLNEHQRAILCYAAKLSRRDLTKTFNEFTGEQKLSIQKAVLQLDKIYHAFSNVNAISPKLFLEQAYEETPLKGVN